MLEIILKMKKVDKDSKNTKMERFIKALSKMI
jgi:hypothetical protein